MTTRDNDQDSSLSATGINPVTSAGLSQQQQEAIVQFQQDLLASVVDGEDCQSVANQVCRLAERMIARSTAYVMLMGEQRQGPAIFAAPSIKALTDPCRQDIHPGATDHAIAADWSVPIRAIGGKTIGSFAISGCEQRKPDHFQRKLLEVGASILSIALEREKADKSLWLWSRVYDCCEEGIIITDAKRRIISVNPAFERVTGFDRDEVLGKSPQNIASDLHDAAFYEQMLRELNARNHWQGEVWNRRRNNEIFPQWLSISSVRDDAGKVVNYIGIFSDITERKTAEAKIKFMAHHDPLTELPNRLLFRERFQQASAQARLGNDKMALLFLDLDNFKMINDCLGHTTGDALLKTVACRLAECMSANETVCRQDGDEFLVLLPKVADLDSVAEVAGKIQRTLHKPIEAEGNDFALSISIGAAVFPNDGEDLDTLLRKADSAMFHAKETGRHTCCFYSEKMNVDNQEHLRIQNNLRRALDQHQFVIHYQPQVNLASGAVIGAETLIRWNHPQQGLISPGRFIPIAESSGLIIQIGEWVLREACRQAVAWQRAGIPRIVVAVNLSALQFKRGNLVQSVTDALADSGLDPACLELELTESILIQDTENTLNTVRQLKSLGVRLSIDDFGIGYSSLSYLKRLRVDKLKIDQSFVRDIANDQEDAAIVSAIIQMARGLNLKTIAEGIETEQSLNHLQGSLCDEAQGYWFGRPMPADAFASYLTGTA